MVRKAQTAPKSVDHSAEEIKLVGSDVLSTEHVDPSRSTSGANTPSTTSLNPLNIPKFSIISFLTDKSTSNVRYTAAMLSLDFGLLGLVDVATRIQQLLHNRTYIPDGMYDGAHNYWPALNFAYNIAGIQGPDMDDEEQLKRRQEEEIAWVESQCFDGWSSPDPDEERRHKEAEARLKRLFFEGVENVPEEEAVAILLASVALSQPGSFQGRAIKSRTVDFLMQVGREEEARRVLELCVQLPLNEWIPRTWNSWRLLISGAVADMLDLDAERLAQRAQQAVETIESRLRDGPIRRPLAHKSEAQLFDIMERNLIRSEREEYGDDEPSTPPRTRSRTPQYGPTSPRRPPATSSEVKTTEQRLGVSLPDDLKAFLRITNGTNNYGFVDTINGTDDLVFSPPAIPDYTLEIFPWPEAAISLPIKAVNLPRIIKLGNRSDYAVIYLIEPIYVEEARRELWKWYDTDTTNEIRTIMDMSVRNYFGGREELEKVEWGVMKFENGGITPRFWPGFRVYFEELVTGTRLEEEEEI